MMKRKLIALRKDVKATLDHYEAMQDTLEGDDDYTLWSLATAVRWSIAAFEHVLEAKIGNAK